MSEQLFPIPGYSDYSITRNGKVWSNRRPSTKGGWLKPGGSKKRYLSVVKRKTWKGVIG